MRTNLEYGESLEPELSKTILDLHHWLKNHRWRGIDPYDIKDTGIYRFLNCRKSRIGRRLASRIRRSYVRRAKTVLAILGHEPREVPKAMGLFLSAYSKLGNVLGPDDCNFAIDHCANWLMENSGQGYPGISWGYPFDWQSKVFVPKNTPSIVVTSTVGEGFFDAYRLTGKKDYLGIAERVGNFIIEGLNRTPATDKTFCFSYTPLDQMCIHNANLMGAAFLLKIGNEIGNDKWMDVALLAAQYSLDRQNTDGSLYYASQDTGNERKHRDIYHSGFEIRAIYQFWNLTQDLRFKESLDRYLQFYAAAYIRSDDGAPVRDEFATTQVFDIHGCAEAILCPASLLTDYPELKEQLLGAYQWSLAHMKNRDGSWAYAIDSKGNVDRTPYVRWGQAWMLRALAELSSKTHKLENE